MAKSVDLGMLTSNTRAGAVRTWVERLWQDLRYGFRVLIGNPGFTAVAVLSIAIGIGANCAIFSFADALLLRPLPVPRPGELLTVGSRLSVEAFGGASGINTSYRDYVDLRDRNKSFEGLAAYSFVTGGVATDPTATPKVTIGLAVSGNFFNVIGVHPELGRAFRSEEDAVPARDAVVVLSRDLWERQFGADPGVLGRKVRIRGIEFTVVGIAPGQFTGMDQFVRSSFYVPMMMWPRLLGDPKVRPLEARDARMLNVKGRLNRGVSMAQAQTELDVIAKDLERAYPDTNRNRGLTVRTELQARIDRDPPDAVLVAMLSTLALAVLLVACANVAGLMTSRSPARAKEMALRLAIGAGPSRLIRQLLTESLLIALVGGVLGLGIGYAGMLLFRQIEIPTDLPIVIAFELDRRALLFSLIVAVGSAVIFGLVPAVQAARTDLNAIMKAGDAVAPGRRRRWGRGLLVGGQVAIAVVLLALATFMYRGFRQQLVAGPGYRTDHLMMMGVDTSLVQYSEAQSAQFFRNWSDRARTIPGLVNVALTSSVPMLNDSLGTMTIVPEGFQFPKGKDNATVFAATIDEHYLDAMGLTILRGRNFRETDSADAPKVAVVNEQFARHYWPDQDAIGKRFRVAEPNAPQDGKNGWVEIVGLTKTSKYIFLAEPPTDFFYLPYKQQPSPRMLLLAQSAGDPANFAAPLRDVIRNLDASLPISNVRTMEALFHARAISVFNVIIGTVGAMGLMGLGLAIVGLYGLVAYGVSRRTKEIGIRMAIGAGRDAVLRMILQQGLALALAGLVVGLLAGAGAERLLQAAFPSGDNGFHPMALILVTPVVIAVTFVATYIPARRASRVDPIQALRYE